jgi:hypothetical protein
LSSRLSQGLNRSLRQRDVQRFSSCPYAGIRFTGKYALDLGGNPGCKRRSPRIAGTIPEALHVVPSARRRVCDGPQHPSHPVG